MRLGSMETALAVRLPDVLAKFRSQNPKAQLTLRTGPTDDLIDHVLAHRLDAALVGGHVHHPAIIQEPIYREQLVLVTDQSVDAPDQIDNRQLLVFKQGCSYRTAAEQGLRSSGFAPVELSELGTLDGILACVAAGIGITLLPRSVVERRWFDNSGSAPTLKYFAVGGPEMTIETMLIKHIDATPNQTLDHLVDIIRSSVSDLRGSRERPSVEDTNRASCLGH